VNLAGKVKSGKEDERVNLRLQDLHKVTLVGEQRTLRGLVFLSEPVGVYSEKRFVVFG